jgi:hypothetical protein
MTFQSKLRHTAQYHFCYVARQVVKLTQVTFSTYTHAYLNVAQNFLMNLELVR